MFIHSHVIYGHFCATMKELSSYDSHLIAHKAQNICYLELFRISLPTPGLYYTVKRILKRLWPTVPIKNKLLFS